MSYGNTRTFNVFPDEVLSFFFIGKDVMEREGRVNVRRTGERVCMCVYVCVCVRVCVYV